MVPKMQKHSFLRSAEGSIASYDYDDFASLMAYKTFYGIGTNEGYYLMATAVSSNDNDRMTQIAAGVELNFDVIFNVPKRIEGRAFVGATLFLLGGGTPPATGQVKVKVYHVRAGAETAISSQITSDNMTVNGEIDYRLMISVDITATNFKKGDILRLELVCSGSNGGAGGQSAITLEPLNYVLTSTSHTWKNTTALTFLVPFKLDL